MASRVNPSYVVRAGGACTYVARLRDPLGALLTQAAVASISRAITHTRTLAVVSDTLVETDVLFDALQSTPNLWAEQYNFRDILPASKISTPGITYRLQYTLTLTDGQILKTEEVDLLAD